MRKAIRSLGREFVAPSPTAYNACQALFLRFNLDRKGARRWTSGAPPDVKAIDSGNIMDIFPTLLWLVFPLEGGTGLG
jgi:hypothetical protein